MARRGSSKVAGAYQLLFHVPKRAVVDRLLRDSAERASVESAYRLCGGKSALTDRKQLAQLTLAQLVEIFARCTATNETDARDIHDSWRYRGMKSLFLYRLGGKLPRGDGLLDRLNRAVSHRLVPSPAGSTPGPGSHFRFRSTDSFQCGKLQVLEVGHCFVSEIDYIDPADEEPKSVSDLRSGFSWLCANGAWCAIAAPDIETRDLIVACLQPECAGTLTPLRFSKEVIDVLEQAAHRRRVALIDPQTKTTRRYTGQHLGIDDRAQEEIRQRLSRDDAPFSGFDVTVDKTTQMVLNYNNRHGKIFFSKDLTSDQLRGWGPAKVIEIRDTVDSMLRDVPKYRKAVIAAHLDAIAAPMREAATMLVEAIAACRRVNKSEHQLTHRADYFRRRLGPLVSIALYAVRDDTEEVAALACSECQSERIGLTPDGKCVECRDCQHQMRPSKLGVTDGKPLKLSSLNEAMQLLPLPRLLDCTLKAAAEIVGMPANVEEEFFFIRDDFLFYRRLTDNVVVALDEIPQFAALLDGPVPASRHDPIAAALPRFKEKCAKMSTANCASCVAQPKSTQCFLRLYALFDGEFTPQPHGSMEYGDYARRITLDGRPDRYCVVLMKSAPKGKGAITSSSREGREILEQAFKYMQDAGATIIGVSVPRLLHDNLKKMLMQLARWHGKKLIYFDEQSLARVVSAVMSKRRLQLADI